MDWVRKVIDRSVRKGTVDFYSSGFLIVFLSLLLFGLFKIADYRAGGGSFGYIVDQNSWLQWVFQLCAFMGLGFSIHFVLAYRRALYFTKERDWSTTKRITELMQEVEDGSALLVRERERYRKIIDNQTEFVMKFMSDGTITFVNKSMYLFMGFTHWSDMVGTSIYDYMGEDVADVLRGKLAYITFDRPRERHTEKMVSRVTGEVKYVDWINCGVFDVDDVMQLNKFQAVGRDVTVLVLAQEQIRESEQRYRLLFTHMVAGFSTHNILCDDNNQVCDFSFTDVNPAFEKLFGFKKGEVVGKSLLEIMPKTEPDIIARFGKVSLTGEPDSFECKFEDINKWFSVTVFKPPQVDFAATFSDITATKDRTGKKERKTDK